MLPLKSWRQAPKRDYKPRDPNITSAMMAAVKQKGSKVELALRKELWSRRLFYRLHVKELVGKPDIVFRSARTVVFVDGDFWHGRALIEEGVTGLIRGVRTERKEWWVNKLQRNVERDIKVTKGLQESGWHVFRFWESEIRTDLLAVADAIEKHVRKRATL